MTFYPDFTLMKASKPEHKYNWYILRESCEVTELVLLIPEGFITDFSTVPRILWPIIPPHAKAMAPSILHDYMYVAHPFSDRMSEKEERLFADNYFKMTLTQQGLPKWQVSAMYWAVRLFGKKRFKNNGEK